MYYSDPDSQFLTHQILLQNRPIDIVWIPSHTGITENERVDWLAKEAFAKPDIDIYIPLSYKEVMTKNLRMDYTCITKTWDESYINS